MLDTGRSGLRSESRDKHLVSQWEWLEGYARDYVEIYSCILCCIRQDVVAFIERRNGDVVKMSKERGTRNHLVDTSL